MWPIKEIANRMLQATEMDFRGRAAGRSRLERVTNERITEIMQATLTRVNEIKNTQLT